MLVDLPFEVLLIILGLLKCKASARLTCRVLRDGVYEITKKLTNVHLQTLEIPLQLYEKLTGFSCTYSSMLKFSQRLVTSLSTIRWLDISGTLVEEIPSGFDDLKHLFAIDCRLLFSIRYLKNTNLEEIDVSKSNRLKRFDDLPQSIRKFTLNDALITDISSISHLSNLDKLSLKDTSIRHIKRLPEGIVSLHLDGLRYSKHFDYKSLSRFKNLKYLSLSRTPFNDVSVLTGLTKLVDLDISNTEVVRVHELAHLPDLAFLDVSGAFVHEDDIKSLAKMLPRLDTIIH